MASGKRASMREGPLAQLFRKTEEDAAPDAKPREERAEEQRQAPPEERRREQRPREPRAGKPLPAEGPGTQATKHVPEPQASQPEDSSFEHRATEAARRAEERARRREQEEPREAGWSRYEGVPTPEERLRSVFSPDIP
jgi:cell division protein FtsZ